MRAYDPGSAQRATRPRERQHGNTGREASPQRVAGTEHKGYRVTHDEGPSGPPTRQSCTHQPTGLGALCHTAPTGDRAVEGREPKADRLAGGTRKPCSTRSLKTAQSVKPVNMQPRPWDRPRVEKLDGRMNWFRAETVTYQLPEPDRSPQPARNATLRAPRCGELFHRFGLGPSRVRRDL